MEAVVNYIMYCDVPACRMRFLTSLRLYSVGGLRGIHS